jgi:NAD(P)-dependent dehydrogenase (short-subunit alcohol dehydrogenase family)
MNLDGVRLNGQVAIVTGGGRGLGRGMAEKLAACGAAVALVGRSPESLKDAVDTIQAGGGRAAAFPADVTNAAAVNEIAREVAAQLGPVDILVNNAGVVGEPGPLAEADMEAWWRVMEVNVRGPLLCTRAVLPGMLERKRGRIVNVASGAANATFPYGEIYCASKAALVRISDCLAAEVREAGISVFVIDPGDVKTDMTDYLIESEAGKRWIGWYAAHFAEVHVPAERSAELVTFLASGQADGLTGRFIRVADDVPDMVSRAAQIQENDLYALRLRV